MFLRFIFGGLCPIFLVLIIVHTHATHSETSNPCTDTTSPKPCSTDLYSILPLYSQRQRQNASTNESSKAKFERFPPKQGKEQGRYPPNSRPLRLSYQNTRPAVPPRPPCNLCTYNADEAQAQTGRAWNPFGNMGYLFNLKKNKTSESQESNESRNRSAKADRPPPPAVDFDSEEADAREEMDEFKSNNPDYTDIDSEESSTIRSDGDKIFGTTQFFDSDEFEETTRKPGSDGDGDGKTIPKFKNGAKERVYVSKTNPDNDSHDFSNSHIQHSKTKYMAKVKSTNGTLQQSYEITTAKTGKFDQRATTSTEDSSELLSESTTSSPKAGTDAKYVSFEKGYQESNMKYQEKSSAE